MGTTCNVQDWTKLIALNPDIKIGTVKKAPVKKVLIDDKAYVPVEADSPVNDDIPVKKSPVKAYTVKKASAKDSPVKDSPVKEAPAKEVQVEEAPVKKAPTRNTRAKKTPATEVPMAESTNMEPVKRPKRKARR
jgi:morphogenetic protein associated with SpoVID